MLASTMSHIGVSPFRRCPQRIALRRESGQPCDENDEAAMNWEKAGRIIRALILFAAGAGAMVSYLHFTLVPKVAEVEWIYGQLPGWWFALLCADSYCRSKRALEPASPHTGPD